MKRRKIQVAEVNELIASYSEAARNQGRTLDTGDHKTGNKESDLLFAIYSELRRRGREAQCALLPLLNDNDPGVRLWSASHVMDFSPSDGQRVLEELIPIGRGLGLAAKVTLEEWRKGRLRFP